MTYKEGKEKEKGKGHTYTDPAYQSVIVDSGAQVVVCLSKFRDKVERCMPLDKSAEVLALDVSDPIWRNGNIQRPLVVDINTKDGAYVIYTQVVSVSCPFSAFRAHSLTHTCSIDLAPLANPRA